MTMFSDDRTGALFSHDRVYRYRLWRCWKPELPRLVFLMLNPSTANETDPDATITRCIMRATRLGYGGIEVINLFALRSTDPNQLYQHVDPIGPQNDAHIMAVCRTALEKGDGSRIILGWGKHGAIARRGDRVRKMLDDEQLDTYALKLNADGSPTHPLYIALSQEPIHISPWAKAEA